MGALDENKLEHDEGAIVMAWDVAAQAMGLPPWGRAEILGHLREDGAWWYEVKFEDGGRQSILKPEGVKAVVQ